MQTFFFAITQTHCFTGCQWQFCFQRYLSRLKKNGGLQGLRTFFGDQAIHLPPFEAVPRNGDIIILYAADCRELEVIIDRKDDFDGLKKILVVANSDGVSSDQYHVLSPRYITQAGRDIDELSAVIQRMKGYIN